MGHIFKSGLLWLAILCILSNRHGAAENLPTETECRPHIEKALNTLKTEGTENTDSAENILDLRESENATDSSSEANNVDDGVVSDGESNEEQNDGPDNDSDEDDGVKSESNETKPDDDSDDDKSDEKDEKDDNSEEKADNDQSNEDDNETVVQVEIDDDDSKEEGEVKSDQKSEDSKEANDSTESNEKDDDDNDSKADDKDDDDDSKEGGSAEVDNKDSEEDSKESPKEKVEVQAEESSNQNNSDDDDDDDSKQETKDSDEDTNSKEKVDDNDSDEKDDKSGENDSNDDSKEEVDDDKSDEAADDDDDDDNNDDDDDDDSKEEAKEPKVTVKSVKKVRQARQVENSEPNSIPEDDLLIEYQKPKNMRDRSHIDEILHLDSLSEEKEEVIEKVAETTLKELKRIYENAIKPLETLYKYRDLSNRHFGDPEIFSKPLVLLMGPYSAGKSTIVNYLIGSEYTDNSIRTGAEPSPAYFNILMHGEKPEILDGTQMSADWTFSGLQKFGEGLQDRIRGFKLPSKLLEKVNIVEIPGILEVRKQVAHLFPFNDACQWFIDRADIILLVYDPAKLDAGPETEAILDQLKGREYQTRILLNKGDQIKAEELLRVQGALIWNISPLMSSAQPPIMYTTSLWSHPFEVGSPIRLLQAHERALLQDLRTAINQRIENKIASARRFAVRVRNHAKMVDCYLTTYYNHKSLFSNKKKISGDIIENPKNYHIYEGLATLTNISRYDLPDPNAYREFFRLHPLYEFKKLSETCTYFRGCPINKLDVSIAYDLPELVGKHKNAVEAAIQNLEKSNDSDNSNSNNKITT